MSNSNNDDHNQNGVNFDKFMDDLLLTNAKKQSQRSQFIEDSPQRLRQARRQDRPLNRINWK